MGKALRRAALWNKYLRGEVEIPSSLRGLSGAPWTIGFGNTGSHIFPGLVWTPQQCEEGLQYTLGEIEHAIVTQLLKRTPTVKQLAAMISFAYNVGLDIDADSKAEGLGDSTLLRKFNAGDIEGAANAFLSWVYAQGEESEGLKKRRRIERHVFLGGSP